MKTFVTLVLMAGMLAGFASSLLLVQPAQALPLELTDDLDAVGTAATYDNIGGEDVLMNTVGRIIKIILGFLGVVLIVIVIYAGFLWMTAGGDPDGVKKAREWLTNAIIGLAIVLSAYAITDFIITKLITATTGVGAG